MTTGDPIKPAAHREISDGNFHFAERLNRLGRDLNVAEQCNVRKVAQTHFINNLVLFELNSRSFCLLPYHHLELANFEAGDGQDTLTLVFLNRTVRITGKNLRELALGLQDRCVEIVKPLPERYAPLVGDEVSVKSIEIEDEKKQ